MRVFASLFAVGSALAADNGKAVTPPMGWRSWNCYGGDVTQDLMTGIMDRMADRKRTVDGTPTSLVDLGYVDCGLDDNWQACGGGVQGSFHDADGNPLINKDRFADMKAMTDHGHANGLSIGFYMNNCICSENQFTDPVYIQKHMERSVDAIIAYGYDGVKLDGCGQFKNLTWWYQLLNATGKGILIENCHWGNTVPGGNGGSNEWEAPCSGTTPVSDCPYNFYRTSGDITNNWGSMYGNLQTTIKFQGTVPLSRPGTWAYPDMMEVGRMASRAEDRTHFGAWVITSSPLILGYDLNDDSITDKIWDFISNKEAIAINQNWAGHPGRLVRNWNPKNNTPSDTQYVTAVDCTKGAKSQGGWAYSSDSKQVKGPGGLCLDYTDGGSQLQLTACTAAAVQQWDYDSTDHSLKTIAADRFSKEIVSLYPEKAGVQCADVYDFQGPVVQLYGCNGGPNQKFDFNADTTLTDETNTKHCLTANKDPIASSGYQMWAKAQAQGAQAVLVFNGLGASAGAYPAEIVFADIGIKVSSVAVRDVWASKDLGVFSGKYVTPPIDTHDSVLLMLTPK